MLSPGDHHHKMAESLHAWWREAGVDYVTEGEPVNWLTPVVARPTPVKPAEMALIEEQIAAKTLAAELPAELAALKAMIAEGIILPGLSYGSPSAVPSGEAGATAMVIGDFPEEEEIAARQFGSGAVARLAANMLLAAEIVPDLTYTTALAHSRPAAASLPKADFADITALVHHHISLVQPKVVVLFGAAACEALLGQELMQARGILHYINHHDRKTAAVATFHPRTLIAQPQLKAQAWKDLQMLVRKEYL